ncbi:hypothetical protein KAU11_02205 [Candidatus Babeliales bacterium]|nr:hypothetical protein [Candidatus Babeliales bacterium]
MKKFILLPLLLLAMAELKPAEASAKQYTEQEKWELAKELKRKYLIISSR